MTQPIKIKDINGRTLRFNLNNVEKRVILNEVFYSENYFPKITTDRDFKLHTRDTVVDIGANVGIFALCAAALAKKGHVYAFEPVRENFERLEKHLKLNRIKNVTPINRGISDHKKRATIYLCDKGNTGGHSLNPGKFKALKEPIHGKEIVECLTLKSVFDTYKIRTCDFLKLDCEGEEAKILYALPKAYFKRIKRIALEFHHPVHELKLARYLNDLGFRVTIDNFGHDLGMIFAMRRKEWR